VHAAHCAVGMVSLVQSAHAAKECTEYRRTVTAARAYPASCAQSQTLMKHAHEHAGQGAMIVDVVVVATVDVVVFVVVAVVEEEGVEAQRRVQHGARQAKKEGQKGKNRMWWKQALVPMTAEEEVVRSMLDGAAPL